MQILVFEHIVFSISARPGRGLAAASSSTSNRVNSKWFKYQKKWSYAICSAVASDGGYILYSIVACYTVCYRTTKEGHKKRHRGSADLSNIYIYIYNIIYTGSGKRDHPKTQVQVPGRPPDGHVSRNTRGDAHTVARAQPRWLASNHESCVTGARGRTRAHAAHMTHESSQTVSGAHTKYSEANRCIYQNIHIGHSEGCRK